ncbi:mucin-6-like isoform X2 [Dermacentor andersoni]|uniref:mucin-6-like isoform X2 n=1 Tax=Dermacentor andersoni TaxID=34620 RepID=UPI003B3B3B32
MKFLVLVVVFGFICLALTRADEEAGGAHEHRKPCGVNEEFKECQSSSCAEWRCGEVRGSLRPCTADCRNDCFCTDEHYRHPNGSCVSHEQCPPSALNQTEGPRDGEGVAPLLKFPPDPEDCGPNEVWKECVSSTCSETSCKKRILGPGCTYDCRYGCYCAEGFYRNAEQKCVTVDQCGPEEPEPVEDHPTCGPNEEWKVCVSSSCAETTCEKRTLGPACTADCNRGCYCSEGFHRNAENKCVTEDQCPPV